MAETVITVRGSFDAFYRPERVTAVLSVGHEGPNKGAVFNATTQSAGAVTARLVGLSNPAAGPVTWWSSDQVRTWSEKPWNQDGKQLPLVFHASVRVEAKFSDFGMLAQFLNDVTGQPGVALSGLTWTLTEARKQAVEQEARQRAVAVARARATDYAAALGLNSVVAVAVADVGMLGGDVHSGAYGSGPAARAVALGFSADSSDGSTLDLTPSDVAVSAEVDARFHAS